MACDNIARGLAEQARLSAATAKSSAETAAIAADTAIKKAQEAAEKAAYIAQEAANIENNTSALGGLKFISTTQSKYDGMTSHSTDTVYLIKEG